MAIFSDAIQQAKPFIFFYTIYLYSPKFSKFQIECFNYSIYLSVVLSIASYYYDNTLYSGLYTHPARLGNCMFSFAMLFYYTNEHGYKQKIITLIILLLGLLSTRSKYYGEFVVAVFFLFFLERKIKIELKYLLSGVVLVIFVLYVTWSKIEINFFEDPENNARAVLYLNMPKVLTTYWPFGSGLASYATFFSGEYYSPLYDKLGISGVWGISRSMTRFVADTFYPSLAQVGFVGISLYVLFWFRRILSINKERTSNSHYKGGWIIILYFLIDSFAAPGFVAVMNFIPLFLLAEICKHSDTTQRHRLILSQLEQK